MHHAYLMNLLSDRLAVQDGKRTQSPIACDKMYLMPFYIYISDPKYLMKSCYINVCAC